MEDGEEILLTLPSKTAEELVNRCIDYWLHYTQSIYSVITAFEGSISATDAVLCIQSVLHYINLYIANTDHAGKEIPKIVSSVLSQRSSEILESHMKHCCDNIGGRLNNLDWKTSVILGSDKLTNLNSSVVTLSFNISSNPPIICEYIDDELHSVIVDLENAKKSVLSFY